MHKLLTGLAVAVAVLATGTVNKAQAEETIAQLAPLAQYSACSHDVVNYAAPVGAVAGVVAVGTLIGGTSIAGAAPGAFVGFVVGSVIDDIVCNKGLQRAMVDTIPGAGFQQNNSARLAAMTHEFNVAMGYSDDAKTAALLASATR